MKVQPNVAGWFEEFFGAEMTMTDRLQRLVRMHYPLKAFGLTGEVLRRLNSGDMPDPRMDLLKLIHTYAALKKSGDGNEREWAQLADHFLLATPANDETSFYHAFYALACVGHAGKERRDLFPTLRKQARSLLFHVDDAHRDASLGLLSREMACGFLSVNNQAKAVRHWQVASAACKRAYEALSERPVDDLERCAAARLLIVQHARFATLFEQEPIKQCHVEEDVYLDLTTTYSKELAL